MAAGLAFAFACGYIAARLRLPVIAGYLLAGIAVGPFTLGYVADMGLAGQLAETGVMLMMFGVGMHLSLRDLLAVKNIAVPGAVVQIVVATALGAGCSTAIVPAVLGDCRPDTVRKAGKSRDGIFARSPTALLPFGLARRSACISDLGADPLQLSGRGGR